MQFKKGEPRVVSVIGAGWSFKGVDQSKVPGLTIGVNDASMHMPTDLVVSMDRLWTEWRWNRIAAEPRGTWLRRSAVQNVGELPGWVTIFSNNNKNSEFAEAHTTLNGSNSGSCALNFAYHLRPKLVIMFGFDMCRSKKGESYWYPPYPWSKGGVGSTQPGKYKEWSGEFAHAASAFKAAKIRVINASPYSAIPNFEKMSAEEACAAGQALLA